MGNCLAVSESIKELKQATYKNTPLFSFDGLITQAKAVKVYDGDTLHLAFRYQGKIVKIRCRMAGYDSAEMKPAKHEPYREEIIKLAIKARDYLRNLVNNQILDVKFGKFEKWGRPLVDIYLNGKHINKLMIQSGHGKAYFGGTKPKHITT